MNKALRIRMWSGVAVLSVALVLIVASLLTTRFHPDIASAADELGKRVEQRVDVLETYVRRALEADPDSWLRLEGLPEDMVVYRYREDTLQSWAHQFPLRNDDIRGRTVVQRLGDGRGESVSPLAQLTETFTFVNYGPKWYLARSVREGDLTVISGLELVNELKSSSFNGINPRLRLGDRYSVQPLTGSIGVPVEVYGSPLFKITSENASEPERHNSLLFWLGILLFLAGTLSVLSAHATLGASGIAIAVQGVFLAGLYFYGRGLGPVSQLFSPLLYADGAFRYSLGAVVILNLLFTMVVLDLYVVCRAFLRLLRGDRVPKALLVRVVVLLLAGIAFICIHIHITFRSIVFNSGICLELFKVSLLDGYTAVVYASFLALALTIPLLLHLLSPLLRDLMGLRYNVFSRTGRLIFAVLTAAYFVFVSSLLGFRKEENRVEVWANRLAMDRDISLEIQLRAVESSIAADPVIGTLSMLENSYEMIRGRLVNSYMNRLSQDYDISAVIPTPSSAMDDLFNERIRSGVRLAENSHFFYSPGSNGRARYSGLFSYYTPEYGASSVLVLVEPKSNREDRGYLSLLGISDPGRVTLPSVYSWAKYNSQKLVQYKGTYAYPTVYSGRLKQLAQQHSSGHVDLEGWCHFVRNVSEDEVIVISRPQTEPLYYVVEAFLFALLAYGLIALLSWKRRRSGGRRYFQNRIAMVVYVSLLITLVAMAVFSVWFVYKRNNSDMNSIMTARINTLQGMLQEHLRLVETPEQLSTTQVLADVEGVGNNLHCDITLFDVAGRVIMSTTPEVYDRMILGQRLDNNAYYNINYAHKRFYMQKERVNRRSFYALYAPVFNSIGNMVAIVSSPFTDLSQDFESEVILHVTTVITIFLLLLLIARFVIFTMVSRMFRPLTALSRKMTVSDVDHLEPLVYDGDDEITPLVEAYNRMVQDLGESSRRLAQVERDKAWTDMARRVAHDLKNPLTPIKLQLQMLIRKKASGDPAWQDRFDEVASTVLYHVDLLADSADQFSTFAKMYDQKAERIDLDALVRQEVDLFDSRDDVNIEYFGLEGAYVQAPRPQLTRVVVNLITNAIQAVEDVPAPRRLLVAVRNAAEDGFYDIVVEDNGPGVSEQNQDKIFTPDFTTKTSGSGLGLAICKRIVEHCGGTIGYSRSFTLGGACFTVKYPKG